MNKKSLSTLILEEMSDSDLKTNQKEYSRFVETEITPLADRLQQHFQLPLADTFDDAKKVLAMKTRAFHINIVVSRLVRDWNFILYATRAKKAILAFSFWKDYMADFFASLVDVLGFDLRDYKEKNSLGLLLQEFPNGSVVRDPWASLEKAFNVYVDLLENDCIEAFGKEDAFRTYKSALRDYQNIVEIASQEGFFEVNATMTSLLDRIMVMQYNKTYMDFIDDEAAEMESMIDRHKDDIEGLLA